MQWIEESIDEADWNDGNAEILYQAFLKTRSYEEWKTYLEAHPPNPFSIAVLLLIAVDGANAERARKVANIGHDKPGGSRDKRRQIQNIWATGKYSSRDVCAEQECAKLAVSFSKARKDLRNTLNPNPWPADPKKKRA